jgi:IS605 OrfB family transposase
MKRKKKSFKNNTFYLDLKNKIVQHHSSIYLPQNSILQETPIQNTCFSSKYFYEDIEDTHFEPNFSIQSEKYDSSTLYKCFKVDIRFNDFQKKVMENWRKAYILMYNETLAFLKLNYKIKFEEILQLDITKEFNMNIQSYYQLKNEIEKLSDQNKLIKNTKENKEEKIRFKEKIVELQNQLKQIKETLALNTFSIKEYISENHSIFSFVDGKYKLNYQNIRSYYIKEIRDKIHEESCLSDIEIKSFRLNKKYNTCIYPHTLDKAIHLATSNYQSGLTNLERGHIKKFSIKFWKISKKYQIMDIEKQEFRKQLYQEDIHLKTLNEIQNKEKNKDHYLQLCRPKLGEVKIFYKKKEILLDEIHSDCKIMFDSTTQRYYLLIPQEISIRPNKRELKSFISLDPGLRTFLTGLGKNEILEIGETKESKLKRYIQKLMELEEGKKHNRKKYHMKMLRRKIKNYVTELHWKTIEYLTNNYKTILLGDMSTKGIVSNETSNITSYNKRLAYALEFYNFRVRLKYKCITNGCNYINVPENYTSKVCSCCGYYKKDLGGNKIYNCLNCGVEMDRDINGCRNILIKSL